MTGWRVLRFLPSTLVLACGAMALVLPSAVTLLAEDKLAVAKTQPSTATAASKPATAPAETKEAKRAKEIERVMEFFKQTQPDVYAKAKRLQETDPAKFESLIQPTIHTVNALEEIKKNDPELYALKLEDYQLTFASQSLAMQLRRPDILAVERDRIMTDLNAKASRQFDIQQQIRAKEIAAIEDKVKKLQATLEERTQNKDKVIKREVDKLTKDMDKPGSK